MNNEMIKITGLKKSYGSNEVLKGIDVSIAEEEVVVVIGPSGGGKSTFLRCINYLEVPTAGSIVFDGIPLNGQSNINEVRKEIGMVFQRFNLFPAHDGHGEPDPGTDEGARHQKRGSCGKGRGLLEESGSFE